MFKHLILWVGVFVAINADDENPEVFEGKRAVFLKCAEEFKVPENTPRREFKDLDPCFHACILKGNNNINDKGMFDKEEALKSASMMAKNNKEFLDKVKKVIEICVSVNEKPVSDGEKGCERAKLLFECIQENKDKP